MSVSSLRKSCEFLCVGVALAGALSAQSPQTGIAKEPQGGIRQQAVAPEHRYFRMIALVHMVGSGKQGDPIRPEFVANGGPKPAPAVLSVAAAAKPGATRPGILSWSMQLTDDKKMAIVHLVAADPKAFDDLRNDKRLDIKVFEIGKHGKQTIEDELKKYKKDFDLEKFQVAAQ